MTDPGEPAPVPADWYRKAFGGDYLRVYRRRSDEAARGEAEFAARELGLAPGDRVLDLACGAGRHSAPLAAAGCAVVGLDLSRPLLVEARARLGTTVPLVRADMRGLPFAPVFAAVVSFFTSFGYFTEEGEDRRVLSEMARVVTAGGGLFLDLPDRETTIAGLVPESAREEDGRRIEERRWITADGRRVEKEIRILPGNGDAEERYHESVRLYSPEEISAALAATGWTIERTHGDHDGRPADPGRAPRWIVVARRGERP